MDATRRLIFPSFAYRGATALALALAAFVFRFFPARDLSNDHYMHLAWAQQLLIGDLPGRDFVEPGMPLLIVLSAAAQYISPGPFSESVLCCLMLAVAAAVIYLVTLRLTGSSRVAIGAALVAIALQPRLYSYPKVLVPAVAALVFQRYVDRPSRWRLAMIGAWMTAAFLFRHDLGLYVAAALAAGLLVFHRGDWRRGVTAVAWCGAAAALILLPYAGFIAFNEGLIDHTRAAIEFTKGEVHQLEYAWPRFPAIEAGRPGLWGSLDASAYLYYLAYLLVALAPLLLVLRRDVRPGAQAAVVVALVGMQALYMVIVLRHPVYARIQDLAGVLPILGGWAVAEGTRGVRALWARRGVPAVAAAVTIGLVVSATTAGTLASVWVLGRVDDQVRDTRVQDGWRKMGEVAARLRTTGTEWPWERFWPNEEAFPAVIPYLQECTAPSDRVFMTWPAPEYYFFARRPFAGGHGWLVMRGFNAARDEDLLLRRLQRESVPVVLINENRRNGFAGVYPRVNEWLRAHYHTVGSFESYIGQRIAVGVRRDISSAPPHAATGWPCGLAARGIVAPFHRKSAGCRLSSYHSSCESVSSPGPADRRPRRL